MTVGLARIEHVCTWLVIGPDARERTSLMEQWIDDREADRLAVFLAPERLYQPALQFAQRTHALVRIAPPGCVCCTRNLAFRVALVRLLRDARPRQVLIELAGGQHLDRMRAALLGYEGLLDVQGVLEPTITRST